MEYVLCAVVGYMLALVVHKALPKRINREVSQEEIRRAKKAQREYENFMNYDGFPSDD